MPSCKIRKQHHHALNFKNTKEFQKEQQLEEKERVEREEAIAMRTADSLAKYDANKKAIDDLEPEHDLALQQEQELKAQKANEKSFEKKGGKKRKDEQLDDEVSFSPSGDENIVADAGGGYDSEQFDPYSDELAEEDMELADMELDTKEAKKELKELDKLTREQEKEADKAAKKERAEMKESDKVYSGSGGATKLWWKKNHNPEVGEDYDDPERKEDKKIEEYQW